MTEHYIVNPHTGKLNTLQEWKDFVAANEGADIKDAEYICIVPDDGTPFVFPKNDIGKMDWNVARAEVDKYRFVHLPGYEDKSPTLPSRKQGVDIGDCNFALYDEPDVHLDDTLEEIGGVPFGGSYFWSASRYGAVVAWYFGGSYGYALSNRLYLALRALPLLLYPDAAKLRP